MITDANMTVAAWLLSSDEAYAAACKQFHAEAIGPVSRVARLEDVIAELDAKIVVLRVDPGSTIALHIQTDQLDVFRRIARGARVERAMAEHRYADIRNHDRYYVPYFGELGRGHTVIALPTERGSMVAAFTADDAIDRFLATGSEENRKAVKFATVGGEELFGNAGPTLAQGVIVNVAGPHPYGFDLEGCRDVANA
jgi:hypothetical protein